MPPHEIFRRFQCGDPVQLGEVAAYCVQDTVLPHLLCVKLNTLENLMEMASATWVPISFLSERGQQIKVFSQISRKARELEYLIPAMQRRDVQQGYEGATVLEAHKGAYYKPITALDFESLYPSIVMAHNLCYTTLVMDDRYAHLEGVEYVRFGEHVFVQNTSVTILPDILRELKAFRKQAKRDMAKADDPGVRAMFNGKQLAYKVSMNSVYGFTGAGKVGGVLVVPKIRDGKPPLSRVACLLNHPTKGTCS